MLGLPAVGREPLLLAAVQERLQDPADDERQDDDSEGDPEPTSLEGAEAERLPRKWEEEGDPDRERDQEPVDDPSVDRQVGVVERVLRNVLLRLSVEGAC